MQSIYGVLNSKGIHTDVSKTEIGAKQYATRNGYSQVSRRTEYHVFIVATKEGSKWVEYKE